MPYRILPFFKYLFDIQTVDFMNWIFLASVSSGLLKEI